MNEIKYLHNFIRKSSVEQNENQPQSNIPVNATVRASLSVPRNPQVGQKIRCIIDLTIGEEKVTMPYVFIQLHAFFEIVQFDTEKDLEAYAQDFCIKQTLNILQEKLASLTELHSGVPIQLPLADNV